MKKFPQIMAILNVTPDSFSDGGRWFDTSAAIRRGHELIVQGADMIDIGGESTRPGSEPVPADEEIRRIVPVISALRKAYPSIDISADTVKFETAKEAVLSGANIINDISGLDYDPRIARLSAETDSALVVMHMQGTPRTMQQNPVYRDVVSDVFEILRKNIEFARSEGVKRIIADVGIGFGKTIDHNTELLRRHDEFEKLQTELLLGISRKSFIGKIFGIDTPEERDTMTAVIHALMMPSAPDIIRVHNVKLLADTRKMYDLLNTDR